jgi:hypothetical protein
MFSSTAVTGVGGCPRNPLEGDRLSKTVRVSPLLLGFQDHLGHGLTFSMRDREVGADCP